MSRAFQPRSLNAFRHGLVLEPGPTPRALLEEIRHLERRLVRALRAAIGRRRLGRESLDLQARHSAQLRTRGDAESAPPRLRPEALSQPPSRPARGCDLWRA